MAAELEGVALTGEGVGRDRIVLRGVADGAFAGRNDRPWRCSSAIPVSLRSAPDPDPRIVDVDRSSPQGAAGLALWIGCAERHLPGGAPAGDPPESAVAAGVSAESVAGGERGISGFGIINVPLAADVAAVRLIAYGDLAPGSIDTGARTDANRTTALGLAQPSVSEPAEARAWM